MIAVIAACVSATSGAAESASWFRIIKDADAFSNTRGVSFVVAAIHYEAYTLSAFCWYRYGVGTDPIVFHGKKQVDGTFRPVMRFEVATEGTRKWKEIYSNVEQASAESLMVSPDEPVAKFSVNMEPFQKAVGVFRYGRLVLENNEVAIFALEDLLPTSDARVGTGDFKEIVFQTAEEKREQGFTDEWIAEPAELITVISIGTRLFGDFAFENRLERVTTLEGTRTTDDDFWPKVKFQAAKSDHVWKPIGESKHSGVPASLQMPSGKAERLRIVLADYKPLIGEFKYGRIVFSNGQAGVFLIDLLNLK